MQKEQRGVSFGEIFLVLGTIYAISNLAFSKKTAKEIGARDKWTCQDADCDDGTGEPKKWQKGWMVHASHWNHDKSQADYDKAESGRIQCIEHHLRYHEEADGQASVIGMACEQANDHAINMLKKTEPRTNWFLKMLKG